MVTRVDELSSKEHYYLGLGRFIDKFAKIEICVQMLLWHLSEVHPRTAQAIFSGTKTDTAVSFIRRIFESRHEELPEILSNAFAQLSIISTVRNDLVHYGAQYDEEAKLIASNALVALPGKERKIPISRRVLEHLWGDLVTIEYCLNAYFFSIRPDLTTPSVAEKYSEAAQTPWQYKQPPQPQKKVRPHSGNRGASNPKPARQRKSSPG